MAYQLQPPRLERTVRVAADRELGIAEYGPEDGKPILWFHGTPGAKRQVPPAVRDCVDDLGVRVICVERPGTGQSTRHLYPEVRAFADDIAVLADELGLERFGLIGLSGGGPYVLAVAHELPDRVTGAVVLGGVAPTVGDETPGGGLVDLTRLFRHPLNLARWGLGVAATTLIRVLRPVGPQALQLYSMISPEGDREAFASPGMSEMFLDDLNRAAAKGGLAAATLDIVLFGRSWGFSVSEIKVPVRFWHGDSDHIVPVDHARHLCELVPYSELHVRPGESHLGTLVVGDEAVRTVVDLWS
ncbi:MAG TPA: alpha/beta hydrolase [Acidimicrobiales bacterium]|nr:alpha/beta hydrolase [Acidimicrobiales bacterium]